MIVITSFFIFQREAATTCVIGVLGRQSRFLSSALSPRRLHHKQIKLPYHIQSATLLSEIDVSKIPKEVPEKGRLVYVGTLANLVKLVKAFSVSTSMMGLAIQPYLYQHSGNHPKALTVAIGGMLSFFIFLTPLMLHFITKRYVTLLYYDDKTGVYTATNYTFFVRERDTKFTPSEVTYPQVPGLFTTLSVGGTSMFFDPNLFLEKEAYIRLMGYDKPMDLKMPSFEDVKKDS